MNPAQDKLEAAGQSPVLSYISAADEEHQGRLLALRQAILKAVPGLKEKISWGMPTFYLKGNVIHFALHKGHIGIYPGPNTILHFQEALLPYKTSKGTIHLPHRQELPLALVQQMTRFSAAKPGVGS